MPDYEITFSTSAERELRRLDRPVAQRVLAAIEKLAANPRPSGCVKLTGTKKDWRIRVGDWRVLYTIEDSPNLWTSRGFGIGAMRIAEVRFPGAMPSILRRLGETDVALRHRALDGNGVHITSKSNRSRTLAQS